MWPSVWASLPDYWCYSSADKLHSIPLCLGLCQSDPFVSFQSLVITPHPGTYYKLPVHFQLVHLLSLWIYCMKGSYFSISISANGLNNTSWEQKRISPFKSCRSLSTSSPSILTVFQGLIKQDCWRSPPWGCFMKCNVPLDHFCCLKATCNLASYI